MVYSPHTRTLVPGTSTGIVTSFVQCTGVLVNCFHYGLTGSLIIYAYVPGMCQSCVQVPGGTRVPVHYYIEDMDQCVWAILTFGYAYVTIIVLLAHLDTTYAMLSADDLELNHMC